MEKLKALENMLCELSEQSDELENRDIQQGRKNIHIVRFPEKAEGNDPNMFFETWFPKILQMRTLHEAGKRTPLAGPKATLHQETLFGVGQIP